ncbi:MAG: hypothetical protein HOI35_13910 [Woeseia sp.]|jgi:hypothetical protein|nr:hypothetical protein [Woeseia sp.]
MDWFSTRYGWRDNGGSWSEYSCVNGGGSSFQVEHGHAQPTTGLGERGFTIRSLPPVFASAAKQSNPMLEWSN